MSSPYDLLESNYAEFLYSEAIMYMEDSYYPDYTYIDKEHTRYRSSSSKNNIKDNIRDKCEQRSYELRCELEAKDILDKDEHELISELTACVNKYKSKINDDVDNIISEV